MARWIVCSAWPYVNSVPHMGTFMHLIAADVYARYLEAKGEEVVAVSGSDEHGTPIEVEALKRGISPREITDEYHSLIVRLLQEYGADRLYYTRTESEVHRKFVQDFYGELYRRGYVKEQEISALYCPRDDMFLPDRFVVGTCPYCGYPKARGDQCERCGKLLEPTQLIEPRCAICGSKPEVRSTRHWFFDLPRLEGELREYVEGNGRLPENARNASLHLLDEGLRPRALTRDNRWGIPAPFPGSQGKTIYVWMEAVLGYISAVDELAQVKGEPSLLDRFWGSPESRPVCFIGKDNIPFHTIIFPALLMASGRGFPLPWQVSSTEYITMEGEKFSKSGGVGVWMDRALRVADGDTWRFVMMYTRPEGRDSNFSWREFIKIVNRELNDNLGNFLHRTLTMAKRRFGGGEPDCCMELGSDELVKRAEEAMRSFIADMDSFRIKEGAKRILELADAGNAYLSARKPWDALKKDAGGADGIICAALEASDALAAMMYPFMPRKGSMLWSALGRVGTPGLVPAPSDRPPCRRGVIGDVAPLFSKVPEDPEEVAKAYGD